MSQSTDFLTINSCSRSGTRGKINVQRIDSVGKFVVRLLKERFPEPVFEPEAPQLAGIEAGPPLTDEEADEILLSFLHQSAGQMLSDFLEQFEIPVPQSWTMAELASAIIDAGRDVDYALAVVTYLATHEVHSFDFQATLDFIHRVGVGGRFSFLIWSRRGASVGVLSGLTKEGQRGAQLETIDVVFLA